MESSREAVYTQNRELSWLRFNDSVLSEAVCSPKLRTKPFPCWNG